MLRFYAQAPREFGRRTCYLPSTVPPNTSAAGPSNPGWIKRHQDPSLFPLYRSSLSLLRCANFAAVPKMPEYGVFWNTQHYGSQSPVRILDRNKEWFQDGFLIVRGDLPSPRAVVSNCRKCALFRSKRRDGPGVCRCVRSDTCLFSHLL